MRFRRDERVEHHSCPESVAESLKVAGGVNPFGEPMFRIVWGYDRIVKMHGEWQEFEQVKLTLTAVPAEIEPPMGEPLVYVNDKAMNVNPGDSVERIVTRLKRSVIETREVPKYLPANCWHLEMWRPAEEYGSPEQWKKMGEEVMSGMTVDTSGEYPSRGEYELCYPLTDDGTSSGQPLQLIPSVVIEIVQMIEVSRNRFSLQQRRAAIEQRVLKEEEGFVKRTRDILRDGVPAFAGNEFVVKP